MDLLAFSRISFTVLYLVGLHRLSSHMCGYKCFQIELSRGYDYNAFHMDLKKLYELAGPKNENTGDLFIELKSDWIFAVGFV